MAVKEYFQRAQPVIQTLQLGIETIRYYATIANKSQIPQISRRSTEKYLYLLAFVAHQYYSLQDALSDIFLRSVQSAINKADDALTLVLREQHGSRSAAVENLLSKYLTRNELIAKLALILSAHELSDAEKVVKANHLVLEQQQNKNQQQDEELVTFLKHAYGKNRKMQPITRVYRHNP